jgi:hypothetical protein
MLEIVGERGTVFYQMGDEKASGSGDKGLEW